MSIMFQNRPMTTGQQIFYWGKYAFGLTVVVAFVFVYQEFTSNLMLDKRVVSGVVSDPPSSSSRNDSVQAFSIRQLHEADCNHLDSLRIQVSKTKLNIWNDWNVSHYPYFLNMLHIPQRSWDVQKAKFVKLLLDARSGGDLAPRDFVAGFSGSSVTAGHGKLLVKSCIVIFWIPLVPL